MSQEWRKDRGHNKPGFVRHAKSVQPNPAEAVAVHARPKSVRAKGPGGGRVVDMADTVYGNTSNLCMKLTSLKRCGTCINCIMTAANE